MTDINTPTGWDEKLKSRLEWLSPEEKSKLLEMLKQDGKKIHRIEPNEKLMGNLDEIIFDLRTKHITKKREVLWWLKWEKVCIDLPAVWNFKWFKFEFFMTNSPFDAKGFEKSGLREKSYSTNEVWKLLKELNSYLYEYGIDLDWNMDFKKDLYNDLGCDTWVVLFRLLGKNAFWMNNSDVIWYLFENEKWVFCTFSKWKSELAEGKLILKDSK